ncbi:MAG: hypothetical protein AAFO82_23880 [Bacteroidota bacterium]
MKKIRGFDFFETRQLFDRLDIDQLERNYRLYLPPKYKLFAKTFELGEGNYTFNTGFTHPNYTGKLNCGYIEYLPQAKKRPLEIHGFMKIEEVFSLWGNGVKEEFEWEEFELLWIARLTIGGGLYLGINGEKKDKIYRIVWDWAEDYEEVAGDIFEFVRGLEFVEDERTLKELGLSIEDLERSWNSKHWSVKKDKLL